MEQHFRLFFAIPLTQAVRDVLSKVQKQLQSPAWNEKVKWSLAENLHITLRFIGDAKPENILELQRKTHEILATLHSFTIEFGELKLFPNDEHPIVLVIHVLSTKELLDLAKKLEKIVCDCGFKPEDRAYNPHLSLGRTKSHLQFHHIKTPLKPLKTMKVTSFVLFDSSGLNGESIHQNLQIFPLN